MRDRESLDQLRRFERLCELYLRRVHASLASEDFSETEMQVIQALDMLEGGGSGLVAMSIVENLLLAREVCR